MSNLIDDLALESPCPYCGAGIGYWCTTKSGATATWLHQDRVDVLQRANSAGYHQGQENALTWAADELEKRRQGERWALRRLVPLVDLAVIAWLRGRAARWSR